MALSDKEYYQLTMSISKALTPIEMPLKVKHARAAIIGTFHSQGAHSFWAVAIRQPLQENRITAWKFCHLLHKVLREGHNLCCQQSMRHRGMLTELGKLWGHLKDGYGLCIKQYTKLLVTKLEFHDRNPRFPGSLGLKRGELDQIGGNDINFYFHMAVEMFDYLDDIFALQSTIFSSLTTFHVNSMTSAGQCRVAPLIPCIQDSSPLYDCLVRIMFKLHASLPNELLTGHRERFRTAFNQLKSFYNQSRNLQYFVNLITVPKLPDHAPNFQSQVDFGAYQAPVVVIPQEPDPEPEPEPDPVVDNLVDMSAPQIQQEIVQQHQAPPQPAIDFELLIRERDDLIRHLQMEIDRLGKHIKKITTETREAQARLEEEIATLNSELSQAHEEMTNMRLQKEELELKAQTAPTLEQKAIAEEERAKASEEKFQKLKGMYTQIRDEHVKLLRQHGEVSKHLAGSTKAASDAIKQREEIKSQLEEIQQQQSKVEETLQQSSVSSQQIQSELNERVEQLITEKKELLEKYEDLEANKSAEIAELKIKLDKLEIDVQAFKDDCDTLTMEKEKLEENVSQIEKEKLEMEEQHLSKLSVLEQSLTQTESEAKSAYIEIVQNNQELSGKLEELQQNYNDFVIKYDTLEAEKTTQQADFQSRHEEDVKETEKLKKELTEKIEEINQAKEALVIEKETLTSDLEILKVSLADKVAECEKMDEESKATIEVKDQEVAQLTNKIQEVELKYQKLNANTDRLTMEKATLESDLQDLLHQQTELDEKYSSALATIAALESSLQDSRIHGETALRALLEACIRSSEKLAKRAISENEFVGGAGAGTPAYFMVVAEELQEELAKMSIVYDQYLGDNSKVEALARKVVLGGHLMATAHIQGMAICNSSADIDCGEHIAEEIKGWSQSILALFESLLNSNNNSEKVTNNISDVRQKLQTITEMIGDLSKKLNPTENIADMFETELSTMDKAIEEAAAQIEEMLSKSRASDSGVKLEVNEKILDACTTLMKAIRVLVQKSRHVQAEIVSVGKGTASATEFYKRNHQWTEGLISAAKNVAQGANFLVTAANKAVSGEAKNQLDLVVAAQEIAASTAQLVVASRVKAPRNSSNLSALSSASKNVTHSTAAVVATAKDCRERLEDSQDMDFEQLTPHQTKKMEMEIQVKVLELEQALQEERRRLAAFRRKNYKEGSVE